MNKGVRILLIVAAVACFGVALYYPINYGMQKNSNANNMDQLAALREAGMAKEDQALTTDEATEAELPAETRVAPAEAAAPVESEIGAKEEASAQLVEEEKEESEAQPGEMEPSAQDEAQQGEAEPVAQSEAQQGEAEPSAQSEALVSEAEPSAQDEAQAIQAAPQQAAVVDVQPQAAAQEDAQAGEAEQAAQDEARSGEAEPSAQDDAQPVPEEAEPEAQNEAQTGEAEPSAQEDAQADEAEQEPPEEVLEEEESDESGISKAIYVGPLETSSNGVAAAIIAQKMQEAIAATPEADGTPSPTPEPTPTPDRRERSGVLPYVEKEKVEFDESKMLERYKEIYALNNDLIGWITIPGTDVDYPVVQTENGEYYLEHDFYGEENINGQIILDPLCDPYTPSYNLVISGHNMRSGSMFGSLDNYTSKSYWSKHKFVQFDTLMDERQYVIFAAFYSADYDVDEDGFRYNRDIQYRVDADDWLKEIRKYQVYDTGIDADFGDEFLTLTTCNHARRNDGRFVLVCRRIREGETIE